MNKVRKLKNDSTLCATPSKLLIYSILNQKK